MFLHVTINALTDRLPREPVSFVSLSPFLFPEGSEKVFELERDNYIIRIFLLKKSLINL